MSRRTAALLIAILFHAVLVLLFWLLAEHAPRFDEAAHKEKRFKVSLKPMPTAKKNAALKNKVKRSKVAPPMPKGRQLKKIVKPQIRPLPKPAQQIEAKPPKPLEPHKKIPKPEKTTRQEPPAPRPEPVPPQKPYIPFTRAPQPEKHPEIPMAEANVSKPKPKAHGGLLAKLSKKQRSANTLKPSRRSHIRESRLNQDIKELYGDEFGKLSEGEQKYILDNQEIMRRITQQVLNRVGRVNIPDNMRVNADNIIEFYLYPNGDISDITFIKHSGFYLLDDTTKETIEYAYSRYPRPKQKTLIRYKVGYFLRGY